MSRPAHVATVIDPFKTTQKRARKPKQPAADVFAEFERQDWLASIWGRPYDGPVRNTKHFDGTP